jgi:phage tail protein X
VTQYLQYTTTEGDRFDTIAYDAYGDPYGYERIVAANPDYTGLVALPGGVRLIVPIVEKPQVSLLSNLPPWKRSAAATPPITVTPKSLSQITPTAPAGNSLPTPPSGLTYAIGSDGALLTSNGNYLLVEDI